MNLKRKAILVTRQTRYQGLLAQYNTESQASFVVESRGQNFGEYREEHLIYQNALTVVENTLREYLRVLRLEREFLPNYLFAEDDLVVVVGQDGLVANTLKYLNGQAVIAINPDPSRIDGTLLPFSIGDLQALIRSVLQGKYQTKSISLARAKLNDGQVLTAVNDIFIGPRDPVSAHYELKFGEKEEIQSSSGVIVSTGLGSTGWLTSIVKGAERITGVSRGSSPAFDWAATNLCFAVREPFPSVATGTQLVYGNITPSKKFSIRSRMASGGVVFSDGMVNDCIDFNAGSEISVSLKSVQGNLVI